MYKVAICEDNKIHLDTLLKYFKNYKTSQNCDFKIYAFDSAEKLLESDTIIYDIVILDIHLKEMNGIDVAKIIRTKNQQCKIIFVTSYDKYSIEGYKVKAYRYVLKPIEEEEFIEIITSIIKELEDANVYIKIMNKDDIVKLKILDIYYLEISNRKTSIYTKDRVYISKTPLSKWKLDLIKHGFSSCHNSFLVNMKYIEVIEKENVVLTNENIVPISKRKYKNFRDDFAKYVGNIY